MMRLLTALLAIWVFGAVVPPAAKAADATPANRFSADMTTLKSSLKAFSETIDTYNRSIKDVTDFDVETARREVAEIRELVRQLLDQLSDSSPLAKSQYELTRWIERNRRLVRSDQALSADRKAMLDAAWAQRAEDIDKAGKEIVAVRKALVDQLNRVIGDETFLTQLLFLEKAGDAAHLIRKFLNDIKSFSDALRQRMEALPVAAPGS